MWAKIKTVLSTVWADVADTWKRVKIYVLGILAVAIYVEWQKIKEMLLAYAGKKQEESSKKQDQVLTKTEDSDNNKANVLIQQAEQLPNQEQPVTLDWNVKKEQK